MKNRSNKKNDFVPTNNKIRVRRVRCIDSSGNNLGVINIEDALNLAVESKLDLVQIAAGKDGIPVCRIIDYGKYKYDISKKQKESAKKQRDFSVKIKEIKFRPSTDINDLKIKASKAAEILKGGNKVKISIMFKGREITHKGVGIETLNKFVEFVSCGQVIGQPSMQGKTLSVMLESNQ